MFSCSKWLPSLAKYKFGVYCCSPWNFNSSPSFPACFFWTQTWLGPYASPKYLLSCRLLFLSRPQLSAMSRQAGWKMTPAPSGRNVGNRRVMCTWDDFPAASPSVCLSGRRQWGVAHGQSTSSTGPLEWLCIYSVFWFNNVVFIAWNNSIILLTCDQGNRLLHSSQTPATT